MIKRGLVVGLNDFLVLLSCSSCWKEESMDRLVSAVPNRGHATVASVDGAADRSTLIVLTYQHAGAERLRSLLTRDPDLACTYGTGILPLCDAAAAFPVRQAAAHACQPRPCRSRASQSWAVSSLI